MNREEVNEKIKTTYAYGDLNLLSQETGLSIGALKQRALRMGVTRGGKSPRGKLKYANSTDRSRINELIAQRYPKEGAEQLAQELAMTVAAICSRASELGIKRDPTTLQRSHRDPLWDEVATQIKQRYPQEGPYKIAAEYNLSIDAIYLRANRLGIYANSQEWYQRTSKTKEKFDTLDLSLWFPELTPTGAYFLGLAWADGTTAYRTPDQAPKRQSTYQVTFRHSGVDREVLDYLAEKLNLSPERVRKVKKYSEKHQHPFCLKLCGRRIADLFQNYYGIPMRKSYIDPPFPSNIPDALLGDFTRGLFDGDGTVIYDPANSPNPGYKIYGSEKFMIELVRRLYAKIKLPSNPIHTHGQCPGLKYFGIYAPTDVRKFTRFLHPDSGDYPYLKRKHFLFGY